MLTTIDFENQLPPPPPHPHNIQPDRHLPFELGAGEPMPAQPIPQLLFGIGHIAAQLLGVRQSHFFPTTTGAAFIPSPATRERVASACEPGAGSAPCASSPLPPRICSGPSPRCAGRGDKTAPLPMKLVISFRRGRGGQVIR